MRLDPTRDWPHAYVFSPAVCPLCPDFASKAVQSISRSRMSGTSLPLRKRDRLRRRFQSSAAPSPSSSSVVTPQPNPSQSSPSGLPSQPVLPPTSSAISPNKDFLTVALQRLSPSERATIEKHLPLSASDISPALDQALSAAKDKRQQCVNKRLTWTFQGRKLNLQHSADNVSPGFSS